MDACIREAVMSDLNRSKEELAKELQTLRRPLQHDHQPEAVFPCKTDRSSPLREDRHGLFCDHCPLPYQSLDRDGYILEVNPVWLDMLGYAKEDVLGRWLGEFLSESSCLLFRQRFPIVLEAGGTQGDRFEMKHADGHVIWAEFSGKVVYNDHGIVCQTHCIFRDITEQKLSQEAQGMTERVLKKAQCSDSLESVLHECVDAVQIFFQCQAVGIRLLDKENNIPYQAYTGFPRSFYEKESPLSIETDHCMCIEVIKGTLDPALPFVTRRGSFFMNSTTRFLATVSEQDKGQTRNVCHAYGYESVALVPIRQNDEILGLLHMADTRENKVPEDRVEILENLALGLGNAVSRIRIQQEIRKQRDFARSLVSTAQVIILILDAEGHIVEFNPYMEAISGYTLDEVRGRNWFDIFIPQRERDRIRKLFAQSVGGVQARGNINAIVTKDGRERDVEWYVEILADPEGNFAGVLAVGVDITERLVADKKLLSYQARLKHLTSELTLSEERERRRIAELLHDDVTQNLVFCNMKLEMLTSKSQEPSQTEVLEDIIQVIKQSMAQVRTLTYELSSPILKEMGFEAAVRAWLRDQVQEKYDIQTRFREDGQAKPIEENLKAILFRSVRELLANAVKHGHPSMIEVSINRQNGMLCIDVRDNGSGCDPSALGDTHAKGFGLFSIRERLDQYGGILTLDSRIGRGCKASLRAPISFGTTLP